MEIKDDALTSFELPSLPEHHVSRSNYVRFVYDRLNKDNRVLIVKGPDGTGKSTFLNEFVRSYPDRTLSFFIGSDMLSSSPYIFLSEMCEQMEDLLSLQRSQINNDVSFTQRKEYYSTLYHQLVKTSRQKKISFFFVVDGLDFITDKGNETSIINLLPFDAQEGIYLIASSQIDTQLPFEHDSLSLPNFSQAETANYLNDLCLSDEKLNEIYSACDGLPGYLAELRREIYLMVPIDRVLFNLPKGYKSLLERNWKHQRIADDHFALDLISLLSCSDLPLSINDLSRITGKEPDLIFEKLSHIYLFIIENFEKPIKFISDAHKKFAGEKVISRKSGSEALIINFLENTPYERKTVQYLPVLYYRARNFDKLMNLINNEYLSRTLQTERDLDLIINNTRFVANNAYEQNDPENLYKYSIIGSILNSMLINTKYEGEVDALLALDDHQTAILIANKAVLPEDRLQLLVKICWDLKKKNLSIPDTILTDIDQLILEIKPSRKIRDRILEIAADLFHFNQNSAMNLINKFGSSVDGKIMDLLLLLLSIKLEDEPSTVDILSSKISDESIKNIVQVNSPIIGNLEVEQLIAKVEQINDHSAKLYMLRSWCNINRKNPKAFRVVVYACELLTSSIEFTLPMRHLRQIAEPLQSCDDESIQEIIDRIDILKNTAIENPISEKIRLELLLAAVETRIGNKNGYYRLHNTYSRLEDIIDLDIKCYCLSRFLISVPEIFPNDNEFIENIEQRLLIDFTELVNNSADQYEITKHIIRAVTSVNPYLAKEFAGKLNTQSNRDNAYNDILKVYIDANSSNISFDYIKSIIDSISQSEKKNWAIVLILRILSEQKSIGCIIEARKLLDSVMGFKNPQIQCFAYVYISKLYFEAGDISTANSFLDLMINAWEEIDDRWSQIEICYTLLTIIKKDAPQFSKKFILKNNEYKSNTPLAEANIVEIYINTIRLIIRLLPDMLKNKNYPIIITKLVDYIKQIPSLSTQAILYCDIALILYSLGQQSDAESIMKEKIIDCLESIQDQEEKAQTIMHIAPVLFKYSLEYFEGEINSVSPGKKEQAYLRVIKYLLSGRNPDDPVDMDKLIIEIDYPKILQVCTMIEKLESDWAIFSSIDMLINQLCKPDPKKEYQETCILIEKHALIIIKKLIEIINKKLPDKDNILHEGYKIVCLSMLVRLKACYKNKMRATADWTIIPPSAELIRMTEAISNIADKAFIFAQIAPNIGFESMKLASDILEKSKAWIFQTKNIIDRINRLIALAEAWKKLNDIKSSKIFLQEALTITSMESQDTSYDEQIGAILELAHSIDPEYASSLTSSIQNPVIRERQNQSLQAKSLQNKPNEISNEQLGDDIHGLLNEAAFRLLKSFCSGRGYQQSDKVICDWLIKCNDASYDDVYNVYLWFIENNIMLNQRLNSSAMERTFNDLADCLHLIMDIGSILTRVKENRKSYLSPLSNIEVDSYPITSLDVRSQVEQWLANYDGERIKIYDAYFTHNDLDILKLIKPTIRVDIFTLWKSQNSPLIEIPEIEKRYRAKWIDICDVEPLETHIYIIGISTTGEGPLHDRYILGENEGIIIGTSISGLGKKDTSLHKIHDEEVNHIDNEFIAPILLGTIRIFKGQKLLIYNFTL